MDADVFNLVAVGITINVRGRCSRQWIAKKATSWAMILALVVDTQLLADVVVRGKFLAFLSINLSALLTQ